jgi:hypothetical protein
MKYFIGFSKNKNNMISQFKNFLNFKFYFKFYQNNDGLN